MNAITDHITSIFLKIKEDDIQCHSEKLRFLMPIITFITD